MKDEAKILDQPKIEKISTITLVVCFFLFLISIGAAFFGGFYFQTLLNDNNTAYSGVPSPTIIPNIEPSVANSYHGKDKQYFDDTIIAMTIDAPHNILVATVARQENQDGANQSARASYFDGEKWTRKSVTKNYQTSAIYTNDIIPRWKIDLDSSRVLKQRVQGSIKIDNNIVDFDTNTITNNIGVRSLPGHTKFMSTGNGSLTINGKQVAANILYTRIYSNDLQEIQFYDTPFGLTTHWLAFWDNQGNFYHIDSTHVDRPTAKYQTHELGVVVDKDGRVNKTFEVKMQTGSTNPPHTYQIEFGSPINKVLNFTTQSSLNKAPDNSYSWYMSNGVGWVENNDGYGLIEYIHN